MKIYANSAQALEKLLPDVLAANASLHQFTNVPMDDSYIGFSADLSLASHDIFSSPREAEIYAAGTKTALILTPSAETTLGDICATAVQTVSAHAESVKSPANDPKTKPKK